MTDHCRKADDKMSETAAPDAQIGLLRIIDAAANRASEGVRVVEDYVRFILDDRHLTGLCKRLRHDLTAALADVRPTDRYAARDTCQDVGTDLTTPEELRRTDPESVARANFKRAVQSIRSLEEYTKVVDPSLAARLEELRYRAYTIERAVDGVGVSIRRLENIRLYVLIDGGRSLDSFAALADSILAAGADAVQLRDKKLSDRELLDRARDLRRRTRQTKSLMFVNDRPELALLAGADGVHLGQDDLSVKDARRIVGPRSLVGVSTHSIDQARQAVLDGANYIGVGPTFQSGTKSFDAFPGLEFVRQVAAEIRLPAFAIGGVTPDNLPQVQAAGLSRIAVGGAISSAADPGKVVAQLLSALVEE